MNAHTVEQAVEALDAAFNRRDLEGVLDCYENDALLVVEPGRSIAGKDNLRGFFELFLDSGSTSRQDTVRVIVNGDLALFLSRWTLTSPVADSSDPQHHVATSVFRRGNDGQWRLSIDNSFGPALLDP